MKRTKNRIKIKDGLTRTGFVAAADTIHEGMEFTYRPMTASQVRQNDHDLENIPRNSSYGEKYVKVQAESVAAQLVDWSEYDTDKMIDITPASVAELPPTLLNRIHWIIQGSAKSDLPSVEADAKN